MRILGSLFQVLAVVVLIGGALLALTSGSGFGADRPSDAALAKGAIEGGHGLAGTYCRGNGYRHCGMVSQAFLLDGGHSP